jgi:CRISPR-associated protein Csx14
MGSRNSTDARNVPTIKTNDDMFPFPDPPSPSTLPVRLRDNAGDEVPIEHWGDNTRRETFKTFAGQQIGGKIAAGLLNGDGKIATGNGIKNLITAHSKAINSDPFGQTVPTGGAFVFDSRGATEALEIGTSLDVQSALTNLSPLVDLLAAVGLQNARPRADGSYAMYYSVWGEIMTADLCRAALAHSEMLVPPDKFRVFRASLGSDKYYKKAFFATEEAD